MKIIYDIAAIILGTFLFLLIFPVMYAIIQLALVVLFFVAELLIIPFCIYLVYRAWNKVRKEQKTIN